MLSQVVGPRSPGVSFGVAGSANVGASKSVGPGIPSLVCASPACGLGGA